jgi:hypothetical protein
VGTPVRISLLVPNLREISRAIVSPVFSTPVPVLFNPTLFISSVILGKAYRRRARLNFNFVADAFLIERNVAVAERT